MLSASISRCQKVILSCSCTRKERHSELWCVLGHFPRLLSDAVIICSVLGNQKPWSSHVWNQGSQPAAITPLNCPHAGAQELPSQRESFSACLFLTWLLLPLFSIPFDQDHGSSVLCSKEMAFYLSFFILTCLGRPSPLWCRVLSNSTRCLCRPPPAMQRPGLNAG